MVQTESISEVRREKIPGPRLVSTHLSRKQQDEVPVLHEFQKLQIVNSCHSRTHWWEFDTSQFQTNGNNSCLIKDVYFSILTSGLIAGGRGSIEGEPLSSHLPTRSGTLQTKKHLAMTYQNQEKIHFHSKWTNTQDAVYWVNLARAQETDSGGQDVMPSLNAILCRQIASTK